MQLHHFLSWTSERYLSYQNAVVTMKQVWGGRGGIVLVQPTQVNSKVIVARISSSKSGLGSGMGATTIKGLCVVT